MFEFGLVFYLLSNKSGIRVSHWSFDLADIFRRLKVHILLFHQVATHSRCGSGNATVTVHKNSAGFQGLFEPVCNVVEMDLEVVGFIVFRMDMFVGKFSGKAVV